MKNIRIAGLLLFLFCLKARAQQDAATKNPAIGIYYCLFDFKSADYLRSHNGQFLNSANMISGLAVSYLNGIKPHFDISVSASGTYTNYTLYDGTQLGKGALLLEGDLTLIGKLLTDKHLVSPYLIAGLGISEYSNYYGLLIPLGTGVQFNFSNIAYLLINAEYRIGVTDKVNDHFYFNIGIAGNIKKRKTKPKPKTPVIPIKSLASDRDGDGVPDSLDVCPDLPGLKQFEGCPDTDGDGIPDNKDKCPQVPGIAKYQGCPIPDTDGDGINDENDSCVLVKGVIKYHGCPVPDTDGDGINNEEDKCPETPGVKENQGCPVISDTLINRLAYDAENIYFKTGEYKLLPASYKALNDLILILKQYPELLLTIEGHTDNVGTAMKNQKLSENRANTVKGYLEAKGGIGPKRLTAVGYGLSRPIANNRTPKGRALNRRVELKLRY